MVKYRIKIVKVTSPSTEREVTSWNIPIWATTKRIVKYGILPGKATIKEFIRKDYFNEN